MFVAIRQKMMNVEKEGDVGWPAVYERMKALCVDKDKLFRQVAFALAKYDYFGGPCDWAPEYCKETDIFAWTEWTLSEKEADDEDDDDESEDGEVEDAFWLPIPKNLKYRDEIRTIVEMYSKGLIPDALCLCDYWE